MPRRSFGSTMCHDETPKTWQRWSEMMGAKVRMGRKPASAHVRRGKRKQGQKNSPTYETEIGLLRLTLRTEERRGSS